MEKIIVRMPPSPTGFLHLGTARTALFNYLFAKRNGGEIIFRWEDTDRERSKVEFETEILDGLKWLGMDFERESSHFFRQTENTPKHQAALKKLWKEEKIFPCFLTSKEINILREEAQKKKINFVFWSPFRNYDKESLQKMMDENMPFVWRLRVPQERVIVFQDLVRGKISVNTKTIGDFVVARNDGSVLYLLANVLDDVDGAITHIIRGEDGLPNTPKQVLLFEALGKLLPQYAHIPLVLDSQNRKLSKRNVEPGICVLVRDFQEAGFLPEGVINGLAFLGWNPKTTEEIFSLSELEKIFDLKNVNSAAARYDFGKMEWFNAQWMRKIETEKLKVDFLFWNNQFGAIKNKKYESIEPRKFLKALDLVREKAKTLKELESELEYLLFPVEAKPSLLENEKMNINQALVTKVLFEIEDMLKSLSQEEFTREILREKAIERITALKLKNGQFLWPFRVALSGRQKSASPFEIAEILGKKETLERIKRQE